MPEKPNSQLDTDHIKILNDMIRVTGACEHNLKNLSLDIPKGTLTVFTGVSGSGKSSLAFDTIFQEGQRRFVESLSAYARQFLGQLEKPKVEHIEGLSPTISVDQKTVNRNPRSTVGTVTEIYDHLRLLFARLGQPHCPECKTPISSQTPEQITDHTYAVALDETCLILAPMVRERKESIERSFNNGHKMDLSGPGLMERFEGLTKKLSSNDTKNTVLNWFLTDLF